MYTTTSSRDEADRLAKLLVDRRLAACVQVEGPITSHYRWQGVAHSTQEWRLLAKTVTSAISAATKLISEEHTYDEPEILFFPFSAGSTGYVSWVAAEVS